MESLLDLLAIPSTLGSWPLLRSTSPSGPRSPWRPRPWRRGSAARLRVGAAPGLGVGPGRGPGPAVPDAGSAVLAGTDPAGSGARASASPAAEPSPGLPAPSAPACPRALRSPAERRASRRSTLGGSPSSPSRRRCRRRPVLRRGTGRGGSPRPGASGPSSCWSRCWSALGTAPVAREAVRRSVDGPLAELAERLGLQLRRSRRVVLLRGDGTTSPMTWGVLRPVILLPAGAETGPRAAPRRAPARAGPCEAVGLPDPDAGPARLRGLLVPPAGLGGGASAARRERAGLRRPGAAIRLAGHGLRLAPAGSGAAPCVRPLGSRPRRSRWPGRRSSRAGSGRSSIARGAAGW